MTGAHLQERFDAVLVAAGELTESSVRQLALTGVGDTLSADPRTHATGTPGVFAAGDTVRLQRSVIHAVADGRAAAACIHQYLSGSAVTGVSRPWSFRTGRLDDAELEALAAGAERTPRAARPDPDATWTEEQARAEAQRCLGCSCGSHDRCRLRHYARLYDARPHRYRGSRRRIERRLHHDEIVYEPGRCIACGLCIRVASRMSEPLGLTFIGRGFDVRVDVPFEGTLAEGLTRAARACAEACPTGALVLRQSAGGHPAGCATCPETECD